MPHPGHWRKIAIALIEPPGNWTAIKVFIGEGEQEAELFLNINEVSRKRQFSIKNPDYGDLASLNWQKSSRVSM
jgi:hypothetical protein